MSMTGSRAKRLALLDKNVRGAISIITDTITALEQTTIEYENEKNAIESEIADLNLTAEVVDTRISENKKLLDNFTKLLV